MIYNMRHRRGVGEVGEEVVFEAERIRCGGGTYIEPSSRLEILDWDVLPLTHTRFDSPIALASLLKAYKACRPIA